jgi:hypothetical protein
MSKPQPSPPSKPSLDSNCENRTRWEKGFSGPNAESDGSASEDESGNWDRQQKRVYHRVNTVLHYWETHGYEIDWLTLTSCPDSDDASELAYNARRLRQTIERARLAYDADGNAHSLTHLDELEHFTIRTSEGPDGKGVLHLFWAWKPHDGQHSRDLFIPQQWLSEQWGRIHGPYDEHSEEETKPLYVWIEEYGGEDYHDRKHVARYCVTQYLGEHAEALEHCSWSHGRTLGGSLVEAWDAVKAHTDGVQSAVEKWEEVVAGEAVTFGSTSDHFSYAITVEPPPNLGATMTEEPVHTPPEDVRQFGPQANTVRRHTKEYHGEEAGKHGARPYDGDAGLCPSCSRYHVMSWDDGVGECESCGVIYTRDGRVVETEFRVSRWDLSVSDYYRQTCLYEFVDDW